MSARINSHKMVLLKNCAKYLYFIVRSLFYPLLVILGWLIPVYKRRPQILVSSFTIFLFAYISNFIWSPLNLGRIIVFALCWVTGILVAVAFFVWGSQFEKQARHVGKRMGRDKNMAIFLTTIPLYLLAILSGRFENMDLRQFAFPILIPITWAWLIVRYYYFHSKTSSLILASFWSFGFFGFYATLWLPLFASVDFMRFIQLEIVALLACMFYDYLRLCQRGKLRIVKGGGYALVIFGLVLFNITGFRIPFEHLESLLQLAILFTALMTSMSYWALAAGQLRYWPRMRTNTLNIVH